MGKALIEIQIRALEIQARALRARVQQDTTAEHSPSTKRTLGDLYGILKGKAQSTEQEIREAEVSWEWERNPQTG